MIRQSYAFEIITPCFAGGAKPDEEAEIRSASIRGQLRWWFRVLGGFQSLASRMNLRQQEDFIFGAITGDDGHAGKLMVRVTGQLLPPATRMGADQITKDRADPIGYLLFPLRQQEGKDGRKGVFHAKNGIHGSFILQLQWCDKTIIEADVWALITVFGQLGSLGFRSRRAMGALRLVHAPLSLKEALAKFLQPSAIAVFSCELDPCGNDTAETAIKKLAEWLRSWRQHGRSETLVPCSSPKPPPNVGFDYALRDHDEGVEALTGSRPPASRSGRIPKGGNDETFRPALGLPIEQRFLGHNPPKVFWDKVYTHKGAGRRGQGRFASPVLLRPRFDGKTWNACVIFVDARAWTPGEPVYVQGYTKAVSLDLYDAMKESLQDSAKAGGPWFSLP